jgi:N-methylhydantoinase A
MGLLGGEFALDDERAHAALSRLAHEMSAAARRKISVHDAAQGVLSVVNTGMERALRVISVERGFDPSDFALVPFGGAGGLHAVDLARSLRIPRIIAPTSAGALSALGALSSDVVKDWSRTVMLAATSDNMAVLERAFSEMEREARATLSREGFNDARQRHERRLAVRYQGQSFELEIKWTKGIKIAAAFHRAHLARYGYAQEANSVEIVSARLRSTGLIEKLREKQTKVMTRRRAFAPPHGFAKLFFYGREVRASIYHRDELMPGARLRSPCIVTEYSSTTLVPAGASAAMDNDGNLIIEP